MPSAIVEYRNENTILVDVGDTIQDNFADIFNEEGIHPMVQGINAIGYDICTTGNHEYNFGMDVVKKYNPCVKKITINDLPDNTNMSTKGN